MNSPERPEVPAEDDPEAAAEFLQLARERYAEQGRGAFVITSIPNSGVGSTRKYPSAPSNYQSPVPIGSR
jgi:hypothetical protein